MDDPNALTAISTSIRVSAVESNYIHAPQLKLTAEGVEFAQIALESGMSKAHYQIVDLMLLLELMCRMIRNTQKIADRVYDIGKRVEITTKTLDSLFYQIDKSKSDTLLKFETTAIDVADVLSRARFSNEIANDFKRAFPQLKLVYRNWEELEKKIPVSAIVLGLVLALDETLVSGNTHHKAYPLYCKLANIPSAIRNKSSSKMSCVLAYFPVLHAPKDGKTRTCTIEIQGLYDKMYRCEPALTAYVADLPEHTKCYWSIVVKADDVIGVEFGSSARIWRTL
ncbi:hypothetical protein BDA99DRAFT_543386 [Phascolomyces articulosus]|uniref:Uncharacterized protein n=1 Tax=Phascolomyces articulosus TaxID=60185 RepID=A0AAD5K150_9FUNG|nr:hypothetical protein BDA99DRAFT_543386 [Phascolomyces articulosus]